MPERTDGAVLRIAKDEKDVARDMSAVARVCREGEGNKAYLYVVSDETQTIDKFEQADDGNCRVAFSHLPKEAKRLRSLLPPLPGLGDVELDLEGLCVAGEGCQRAL